MKSSVEVLSPTRVRLDVEVAYSELESHVANAYKKVASQVNIPGFRKGKIPAAMIDQRVGRGAVIDEAINAALPEFYGQAAREHKVAVIGRPEVDVKEFVDKDKLVFTVEVDVRPEVVLPDFSKITIEVDDVKVEDSDIDEQIESLRTRFGTLTTVEREVKMGDFATLDMTAFIDGAEVDGGQANDISYEVGSDKMIDGLDEILIGMKAGDVKQFETKLVGQQEGVGQVTANLCRCLTFHMLMILALILAVSTRVLTVAVAQWTTIPPLCVRVILTTQCQDQACFGGQFDRRVVESSG